MNTESAAGVKDGLLPIFREGFDGVRMKKPGGWKSSITDENKEIVLSALFNDPYIFGYLRNTWSLRSLARCLTGE